MSWEISTISVSLRRQVADLRSRGDDGHQGRRLEHVVELVAQRRDDHPERLRQDDPAHRQPVGHPQRLGSLRLTRLDGQDPGPDDLAHVRTLIDRQRHDPRQDGAAQAEEPEMDIVREEVDPEEVRRPEIDDEHLDEQRRAPEEPDVEPADGSQDPIAGHPGERREDPDDHPEDL
jgi:hypothetical protein